MALGHFAEDYLNGGSGGSGGGGVVLVPSDGVILEMKAGSIIDAMQAGAVFSVQDTVDENGKIIDKQFHLIKRWSYGNDQYSFLDDVGGEFVALSLEYSPEIRMS